MFSNYLCHIQWFEGHVFLLEFTSVILSIWIYIGNI